ncbi:ABC transporter permease (plasmid) [Agrobacterium leguminum]|uniref:Spermidine/putrescine ABC transpoter (Permease protein) n=1 Tax=Agrobacterium deltaense NCPPB 1641 TaxID=1183425 RepID=A0A1S7U9H2_9HYPH|nr:MULTISPECIES: ABC transporter permease [Agrobacterium]WFS69617.1 ABC transporter permease [Agrobacterium leguminum]CVI63570.1 Putative Spermidine/putrescine ABC transpoter (permease protein) [Agrobacterium deltaense NCPPB 1641]
MMRTLKASYGIAGTLFMIAPLLAILPLSFNGGMLLSYPMNGVSLRWFEELLTNNAWRLAIFNSLFIGFVSATLSVILGTLAALGLRGHSGGLYGLCRMVFLLPMVAPVVVLGVGMQILMSRMGLTNSYPGVIIAHTVVAVPFVVVSVSASLAGIDRTLERAAASLGAPPWTVFRRLTLPLAMPGLQSGAVFAFATSLDEVILTLFLGGANQRTLAREMFSQLRDNVSPAIAAAAFMFIVGTTTLSVLTIAVRGRRVGLTTAN